MKKTFNQLFSFILQSEKSTNSVVISERMKFKTTQPDVKLSEKEWMRRYKVGSQYSRFSQKKPSETVGMFNIYQHNC
jgi:hypothetical protein